ncbi:Apoptosis inhibitor [Astathelohania contejeani]|uniref:Apoptosis inhibitor n=1 Tax=Astathelohania contejeani TaxID=164912 RepID=A0ABQ7HV29_9MICR|nr:Apoptosis inhibitor [Thelohania contejeani]QMS79707.1 hypothetical protein IIV6-T1_193 [Invertebrate iridescent virus 6]
MDTCGIYNSDNEEFSQENDGENDGGDKIIKNLPFASYDERLNSFQNWPIQLLPSKEQLSRAGFIYLNIGDQVQCFYCDLKLKEWKRSDNPFEEHKKHTQDLKINCLFVKSIEFDNFVKNHSESCFQNPITNNINQDLDHNQDLDQNSTTSDCDVLTCKICFTNKITKVLIPCGHSSCYECVFKLQTCPICKNNFIKINNLFI